MIEENNFGDILVKEVLLEYYVLLKGYFAKKDVNTFAI